MPFTGCETLNGTLKPHALVYSVNKGITCPAFQSPDEIHRFKDPVNALGNRNSEVQVRTQLVVHQSAGELTQN